MSDQNLFGQQGTSGGLSSLPFSQQQVLINTNGQQAMTAHVNPSCQKPYYPEWDEYDSKLNIEGTWNRRENEQDTRNKERLETFKIKMRMLND